MIFKKVKLQSQKQGIDLALLAATGILVLFGLLMVYDASVVQGLKDFKDSLYYIRQQLIWVSLGLVSMLFFTGFDFKQFKFLATPFLLFSLVLLLAVFIPGLGVSGGGAHRWLKFLGVTLQPTEIVKLAGVIYLAVLFEKEVKVVPFLILTVGVTFITAVLQKDLGSSAVFVVTAATIYFAAGGSIWHFIAAIPVVILSLVLLILTSGYRSQRILAFLNPFSDLQGFTYHISQVLIALGSGGIFGLGLGQSRQKFEYIPQVSTDSIFAIVGEELGLMGGIFIVALFTAVILRGFKIAENCQDNFGKILALGLTSWLGIQAIINLSSMTALLPLTGVPLPFISYGGSALVANLTAVGILLNISRQTKLG